MAFTRNRDYWSLIINQHKKIIKKDGVLSESIAART